MDLREAKLWDLFVEKFTAAIDVVYQFSTTTTQSQAIAEIELRLEDLQSHFYSVKEEKPESEGRHGRKRRLPARYSGPDVVTDFPRLIKREKLDDSVEEGEGGDETVEDPKEVEAVSDPLLENILAQIEHDDAMEQQEVEEEMEREEAANEEEDERIREEENEEEEKSEEERITEEPEDAEYVPEKHEEVKGSQEDSEIQKSVSKPKQNRVKAERKRCDQCDFSVKSVESMRRHQLRKHHTETQCPQCDLKFTIFHKYLTHLQRDHKNVRHECSECKQVFFFPNELKLHIKSQHTDKSTWEHLCEDCGQAFPSKPRLNAHMHTHLPDEQKNYVCEHCPYRTSLEYMLRKHILNRHPTEDGGGMGDGATKGRTYYQCEICERRIKYAESFRVHMRRHWGERPFKCEFCPAAFPSSNGLSRHRSIHGEPQHKCGECGRLFHTPGAVTRHALVHRAAAQACRWCAFTTTFTANLRRHCQKMHGESWPPPSEMNKRLITTPVMQEVEGEESMRANNMPRGPRPYYDNNKLTAGNRVVRRRGRPPKNLNSVKSKAVQKRRIERPARKVVVLGEAGDVLKSHKITPLHKNIRVTKRSPEQAKEAKQVVPSPQKSRIQVKVITEGSKENSMQLQVMGEHAGEGLPEGQEIVLMEEQYASEGTAVQEQYFDASSTASVGGVSVSQYHHVVAPQYRYSDIATDSVTGQQYEVVQGEGLEKQYSADQQQYQVLEGLQLQEGEQLQVVGEGLEMLEDGQYQVLDGQLQVVDGGQHLQIVDGKEGPQFIMAGEDGRQLVMEGGEGGHMFLEEGGEGGQQLHIIEGGEGAHGQHLQVIEGGQQLEVVGDGEEYSVSDSALPQGIVYHIGS